MSEFISPYHVTQEKVDKFAETNRQLNLNSQGENIPALKKERDSALLSINNEYKTKLWREFASSEYRSGSEVFTLKEIRGKIISAKNNGSLELKKSDLEKQILVKIESMDALIESAKLDIRDAVSLDELEQFQQSDPNWQQNYHNEVTRLIGEKQAWKMLLVELNALSTSSAPLTEPPAFAPLPTSSVPLTPDPVRPSALSSSAESSPSPHDRTSNSRASNSSERNYSLAESSLSFEQLALKISALHEKLAIAVGHLDPVSEQDLYLYQGENNLLVESLSQCFADLRAEEQILINKKQAVADSERAVRDNTDAQQRITLKNNLLAAEAQFTKEDKEKLEKLRAFHIIEHSQEENSNLIIQLISARAEIHSTYNSGLENQEIDQRFAIIKDYATFLRENEIQVQDYDLPEKRKIRDDYVNYYYIIIKQLYRLISETLTLDDGSAVDNALKQNKKRAKEELKKIEDSLSKIILDLSKKISQEDNVGYESDKNKVRERVQGDFSKFYFLLMIGVLHCGDLATQAVWKEMSEEKIVGRLQSEEQKEKMRSWITANFNMRFDDVLTIDPKDYERGALNTVYGFNYERPMLAALQTSIGGEDKRFIDRVYGFSSKEAQESYDEQLMYSEHFELPEILTRVVLQEMMKSSKKDGLWRSYSKTIDNDPSISPAEKAYAREMIGKDESVFSMSKSFSTSALAENYAQGLGLEKLSEEDDLVVFIKRDSETGLILKRFLFKKSDSTLGHLIRYMLQSDEDVTSYCGKYLQKEGSNLNIKRELQKLFGSENVSFFNEDGLINHENAEVLKFLEQIILTRTAELNSGLTATAWHEGMNLTASKLNENESHFSPDNAFKLSLYADGFRVLETIYGLTRRKVSPQVIKYLNITNFVGQNNYLLHGLRDSQDPTKWLIPPETRGANKTDKEKAELFFQVAQIYPAKDDERLTNNPTFLKDHGYQVKSLSSFPLFNDPRIEAIDYADIKKAKTALYKILELCVFNFDPKEYYTFDKSVAVKLKIGNLKAFISKVNTEFSKMITVCGIEDKNTGELIFKDMIEEATAAYKHALRDIILLYPGSIAKKGTEFLLDKDSYHPGTVEKIFNFFVGANNTHSEERQGYEPYQGIKYRSGLKQDVIEKIIEYFDINHPGGLKDQFALGVSKGKPIFPGFIGIADFLQKQFVVFLRNYNNVSNPENAKTIRREETWDKIVQLGAFEFVPKAFRMTDRRSPGGEKILVTEKMMEVLRDQELPDLMELADKKE